MRIAQLTMVHSMSLLVDISGVKSSQHNLELADPGVKCKYANFVGVSWHKISGVVHL
jgi:hypothetical protein